MKAGRLVPATAAASVLAGGFLSSGGVDAADYPTRTVRVVIGFSAGGGTDIAGRILAQRLTENMRQHFIVENRLGASGTIGADHVAKSPPGGYTMFIGSPTTHAVVPQLLDAPPYHPLCDFAGVREIVAKLSAESKTALSAKTVEDKLAEMGYSVVASTPAEFTKRMESEYEKWGKVIKQAGIKMR